MNRMLILPITKQSKQQEWKIILTIAQNNGFRMHITQSERKTDKKTKVKTRTKTTNYNNTTEQEMGNLHIP